ncbi:MAG: peptide chain release factor N(5)-glutamine methyltransferase [Clostridiales bacterium]|nr:peptide chain release factor N(5)-glutamine methyltransferase [Clostridiales bacterium]
MSKEKKVASIGGQAVIEGVMMKGKTSQAIAVRSESGDVLIESKRLKKQSVIAKIPFLRGVVALFQSMVGGTECLMRSASVFGEEETSKFDDWLSKKLKISAVDIASFIGVVLGLVLSLFLFFYLPQVIADLFLSISANVFLYCLIEGLIRITLFISYILLTSLLKDIKRTYMYHGAEHKTISCYENGMELTVENVKKCSRVHDRCGTTFMFLVMVISILMFAVVNAIFAHYGIEFEGIIGKLFRFLIKLLTLPIIAGISYEILKLLAKTKSKWVIIFKFPGLLLQRLTTKEPTDDMIEVAITSFTEVLKMDEDQTIPEKTFNVYGSVNTLYNKVVNVLKKAGIEDLCDAEWIVARVTQISRSQVIGNKNSVTKEQTEKALEYANKRSKKIPLAYVFGDMDFYGYTFAVNESVLIPRPETEELVMHAIKEINSDKKVLDLCSGSGAIGITVNLKTNAKVTLVDVSCDAINMAKTNAEKLGASVNFVQSNMFESVEEKFDFILSNPPYIKSDDIKSLQSEVKNEPILALDGGESGLDFYEIIANNAYNFLNDGGALYLECGIGQASDIVNLLEKTNEYKDVQIIKDVNQIDRIIKAVKL